MDGEEVEMASQQKNESFRQCPELSHSSAPELITRQRRGGGGGGGCKERGLPTPHPVGTLPQDPQAELLPQDPQAGHRGGRALGGGASHTCAFALVVGPT